MSSRQVTKSLAIAAVLCAMVFFASFGRVPQAIGAEEIVVCVWGGEFNKTERIAFFDPFEKDTGITVKTVSWPQFAKMKAMVETGNVEWDVATIEKKWLLRGVQEGIFEPLDYSVIDTSEFLPDTVHPYGVLSEGYAHAIEYNSEKYSEENHPRNWREFWDVKRFPGPRSLYNNPAFSLEQALLADGVPPDKLYPLDVDRAFKSLDRIKPHVSVWYKNTSHAAQLMSQKEVDFVAASHSRMYFIRKQGTPVGIEMNQAITDRSFWAVLKGTKHRSTAMKLIHYITRAKRQADWVNLYPMVVANGKAYNMIQPEILSVLPTSPQNIDNIVWMDSQWWAENEAEMFERWNEWMLKK